MMGAKTALFAVADGDLRPALRRAALADPAVVIDLVRSLGVDPGNGIVENIGEPYEFELPYWAGERPVERTFPGEDEPYPLPFHPLELGEDALRAFFGFILEGRPHPEDIEPFDVPLRGFRVADPTGREQAEREAAERGRRAPHAAGPGR
ncbi:DUF6928 family protein [Actinoplanes sp. CA-131856]